MDLVKYISFLSFTSTCVGWYLQCRDSVTLATFWDNIFPVLQWHFKNSVFTSKWHPLAPWRCDSVVAEQRDTLEISSGCISGYSWLLHQGPGQPCGLWKKEATKTSSIKKMSVPHTAGMLTAVQRLTRTGAAVWSWQASKHLWALVSHVLLSGTGQPGDICLL